MATHTIPYTGSQIDDSVATGLGQGYCTCSTAAATAAKIASLTGYQLTKGGIVAVKFENAVPANATLSINSQTAKALYYRGSAIAGGVIDAGETAVFMFDGSYYRYLCKDQVGGGSENGSVWQDGNGYIHLSPDPGTHVEVDSLTVNSAGTYTAPTGHAYSPVTVPSGTAGTPSASKGTVSNHSVSVTPSVTNTTGYITGGTKTGTAVTVSASELDSGTKSIASNGTGIDVVGYAAVDVAVPTGSATLTTKTITVNGTYNASSDNADGYSSVTVNVSGGSTTLKMGVIRPDAELVKTWSEDALLIDDLGTTMPSYTTNTVTVSASAALTPTYTLNTSDYYYYVLERCLVTPSYSTALKSKAMEEYFSRAAAYEIISVDSSVIKTLNGTTTSTQYLSLLNVGTWGVLVYWTGASTANSITTGYGVYPTFVIPAISGNEMTVKSPSISLHGSSSYLSETNYNAITDVRLQYVIELYRAPKNSMSVNGWQAVSQSLSVFDDIANNNGTLT